MSVILNQLFQLVKLLNSDTGSKQLAAGFAAGFILGMTPSLSLQSFLVFICIFLFRIQVGAALASAFFFKFVAFLFDPAFDAVGAAILAMPSLEGLWTQLYNLPVIPWTRFNNTIVMGSGVIAIILAPFVFWSSEKLVLRYRVQVVERFRQTKFWKAIQATAFYKWYVKAEELYG